jgi:hypothetical protein
MMNRYVKEKWSWIEGSHQMRTQLLDMLSDADLEFNPGGQNMSLGALFREMGEVEYAYAESLKTFQQDWSYRNEEAGLDRSVARLKEWFQRLDEDLKAAAGALTDEDLMKMVGRGGFALPADWHLDAYLQAVLIFFGKVTIYLKAMNRELPMQVREFIG